MRKIWHFLLEHLRINKILEKEDKILELQKEILYAHQDLPPLPSPKRKAQKQGCR